MCVWGGRLAHRRTASHGPTHHAPTQTFSYQRAPDGRTGRAVGAWATPSIQNRLRPIETEHDPPTLQGKTSLRGGESTDFVVKKNRRLGKNYARRPAACAAASHEPQNSDG